MVLKPFLKFWIVIWKYNVDFQKDRDPIVLSEKNHESLEAACYYNGQPRRNNFWIVEFQASCFTTNKILTNFSKSLTLHDSLLYCQKFIKVFEPIFCQLNKTYNVSVLNCMMIWSDQTWNKNIPENWVSKQSFLFWYWQWLKVFFLWIKLFCFSR